MMLSWSPVPTRTGPCHNHGRRRGDDTPGHIRALTRLFLEAWQKLGISFDLFTHTDTENHWAISQDFFSRLLAGGYLYKETSKQIYCENDARFLPDRYITGTCPICAFPRARGDQCDNCGNVLDALELKDPRCRLTKPGDAPHRLVVSGKAITFTWTGQVEKRLLEWLEDKTYWKPNVLAFVRNYLREGLHGRAITRATWTGAFRFHSRVTPASACTFGSRRSSAITPHPSSGPRIAGHRTDGKSGGRNPMTCAPTILSARTISRSHTIIWPAMLLGYDPDLRCPMMFRPMNS